MTVDDLPRACVPVSLDVTLTVGATTTQIGTITADTPAEGLEALAGLLREFADGIESPDGLDGEEGHVEA